MQKCPTNLLCAVTSITRTQYGWAGGYLRNHLSPRAIYMYSPHLCGRIQSLHKVIIFEKTLPTFFADSTAGFGGRLHSIRDLSSHTADWRIKVRVLRIWRHRCPAHPHPSTEALRFFLADDYVSVWFTLRFIFPADAYDNKNSL